MLSLPRTCYKCNKFVILRRLLVFIILQQFILWKFSLLCNTSNVVWFAMCLYAVDSICICDNVDVHFVRLMVLFVATHCSENMS